MSKSGREQNRRERAAAIQAESHRAERNRRMGIVGGVVLVLAIIVAGGFWYSSGSGDGATPVATSASVGVEQVGTTLATPSKGAAVPTLVVGPKSAPMTVTVYEDFLCPFCREFEMASRDYLRADAAKGLVRVAYRPFHLLPEQYSSDALNAYVAVLKNSGPKVALKFHDLLYDKQPYENASSFPDADKLASWAKSVGADPGVVRQAVQARDLTYQNAADKLASMTGLKGTPTIFVNGKQLSGTSISDLSSNLETMIAKQQKGGQNGAATGSGQ